MSDKKIKLKTFEEKYNDTCQLLTKLREIYLYGEETNITVISETWGNVCNILNPPELSDEEKAFSNIRTSGNLLTTSTGHKTKVKPNYDFITDKKAMGLTTQTTSEYLGND